MAEFFEEHLRVIIFVVIALAALLQKILEAGKAKRADTGPTMKEIFGPDRETAPTPSRRKPYTPPPLVRTSAPPPLRQPTVPPPLRGAAPMAVQSAYDTEAELTRQREMEERIRRIREAKSSAPVAASAAAPSPEPPPPATASTARVTAAHPGAIHRRLRHPREVRRAFVLKEILDRPLGLR